MHVIQWSHCREYFWCLIFQAALGAFCVAINPPVFDDPVRLADTCEPVPAQALIPKAVIETFDVCILGRPARIDEAQLHTVVIGPSIKGASFSAVTT